MLGANKYMNEIISIIMPTYNSEKYIAETISSVQAQTYKNWELVIVDDCSTDKTVKIIKNFINNDDRIKLFILDKNQGASQARNFALEYSTGRFIAYLDSDDLWKKNKLLRQVEFMKNNKYVFSCTSYEIINNVGLSLNKFIHMPTEINYTKYLKYNILQTVGIMIDLQQVDKSLLRMPNTRIGEDAATWLQILKAGYNCYGLDENLAAYRRRKGSLSSNKFISIFYAWNLYRNIEKLPFCYSVYCFMRYSLLAICKRIYIKKGK